MVSKLRRNGTLAAAVVATGAIALATPGMASLGNAKAKKVPASQVSRSWYLADGTFSDNFNTCAFTPIYSKAIAVPRKGVVNLVANVNAERDFDNAAPGELTTRVKVDGVLVSAPAKEVLDGSLTHTLTMVGGTKVTKGGHNIVVEAQECGTGMAFIVSESLAVNFSSGGAATSPAPTFKAKSTQS